MEQRSAAALDGSRDQAAGGVEVVALVASAGGLQAMSTVLRALPSDFPAAVVVAQHLGSAGSAVLEILDRRIELPVDWARDGGRIEPGRVTVTPPRAVLEVLPDRTCAVRRSENVLADRPLDALLRSVGDSVGAAGLGVVLTGMGDDGVAGAAALRAADGVVIAQSEDTAEQPAMPAAAAAAGAVDLVFPLHEIGPALVDAALGRRLPLAPTEAQAIRATFGSEGVMAARAGELDWSRTALGPVSGWSPTLRALVRSMMGSPDPACILWGDDLLFLFNDALAPTLVPRDADALARPLWEVVPENREAGQPQLEPALRGEATQYKAVRYRYEIDGQIQDIWWDMTDTPIWEADGTVAGVQRVAHLRTDEVLAARRLAVLDAIARAPRAGSRREALAAMVSVLSDAADVLFAVGYLVAPAAMRAGLVAAVGVEEGGALAPREIRLVPGAAWPLHEATGPVLVNDLGLRFRGHRVGTDGVTPAAAVVNPLRDDAEDRVVGHLVLGVDPYVKLDDRYREFLMLVADAVAARMAEAHARRRELHRLERLAELDRAKTEFFSNVSHEFRTPLTLMLGPLEQLLEDEGLPAERKADLQLIGRSAHRLLRLVGTMLDFSQIEAGRLRAHFAPVDLANRTREIVGQFESAAALAGLELRVDIDELPERVWVDAEMWEKIVSNLLSNALKFTFDGEIEVALRALPKHAELTVRDTGVGIAEEELPHIFERFHRVRGSRARSQEGAGIGLALVDELVRRHHGRIRASSRLDAGTTFTVWVPLGRRPARPEAAQEPPATTAVAAAMADEAMQWGEGREPQSFADDEHALRQSLGNYAPGARVLVADDNQDMREYLTRLLTPHWGVEAVPNGTQALEQARANRPDLVLADVMMPGLDGFALLRELREDAALRAVPVVLVTARAGEEAAIEGLLAGADDYIVKPFAARELVARVGGQLELARIRRRAAELNAFRIGLSDALRELADPLEIQRTACRMLLDQIAVDRARFVEVDEAAGEFVTLGGHAVEGMPDGYGRYPIAAYAPLARAIASGQVLAIEDSQNNDAVHDIRDALAALEIGAQLVVPLARSGRSQVALAVHHRTPRRWSPEDIAIAEEVAGRAWAEVERARAEESLRASEARFRALAETSPVGVAVTDAEKSVIVYSNRAYAAIMGRDPDELEGQPSTSVYYDPADRSWLAEMTASGAITGHEVRFKHKDGSPVWVSINVAPIDFAGRPAIIGIVQRQQDGP